MKTPLELVGQEYAAKQCAIEAGIQHRQLPLGSPGVQGIRPPSAPHREQVAHLKNGKYHKLKERRCRKGVEERLYHNACTAHALILSGDPHAVNIFDSLWRARIVLLRAPSTSVPLHVLLAWHLAHHACHGVCAALEELQAVTYLW